MRSSKTSDRDSVLERGGELSLHRVRSVAPGSSTRTTRRGVWETRHFQSPPGVFHLLCLCVPVHPHTGAPQYQRADSQTTAPSTPPPEGDRPRSTYSHHCGLITNPRALSTRTRRENTAFASSSNCSLFNSLGGI